MRINYQNAEFIKSAAAPDGFLRDSLPLVVFSGRSNVGKSSVINRLTNRANFARVGAQPGKTSHVNYFKIDNTMYLVDLPGYGYAKVSQTERARWAKLMEAFFDACSFRLGVMIVDARHKPTADDITMGNWFQETGTPVVVVANKCDKVKKSQLEGNLTLIRETLALRNALEQIPFSAETGAGRGALLAVIENALKGGGTAE